jgi:hypothetical protein
MPDERTVSTITWLNSPKRSKQKLGTLRQHIQIRQWHRYNPSVRDSYNALPAELMKFFTERRSSQTIDGKMA